MALFPNELVINDDWKDADALFKPKVNGMKFGRGYDPESVDESVRAMLGTPDEIKVIPKSEWSARIKQQEETKSRTSDILRRKGIASTDQDGDGYCWMYSGVGCVIARRAVNNQKYVRLNAHSSAAIIKKGRNEGGWCGLSSQFLMEHGVATFDEWPEHSRDTRHDTPETRKVMAKYRVTEAFIDLTKPVHGRNMTFEQVATCLLRNIPVAVDFNWWTHSVLGCDLVEIERGSFGIRIRNSWTDSWGDKGFSVLEGSKTIPNGAVAIATVKG
jgi:hypothetical protein